MEENQYELYKDSDLEILTGLVMRRRYRVVSPKSAIAPLV